MPQPESSFLARPLGAITGVVVRFPLATLVIATLVAAAAIVLTGAQLGFRTSRLDLLNPKSPYNRLWLDYVQQFGDEDDAVIVVEGPSSKRIVPVLDQLALEISAHEGLFRAVLHRVELDKLRAKGLHYLAPEALSQVEQFVDANRAILDGDWSGLRLASALAATATHQQQAGQSGNSDLARAAHIQSAALADSLLTGLEGAGEYRSPWPAAIWNEAGPLDDSPRYLLAANGQIGFVLLRLADEGGQFDRGTTAIDQLRTILRRTGAAYPDVRIGLTGLPVMENDELRESQASMWKANLLSLVGVSIVVVACFGGVRHPLLAAAAFMLALVWSFGYITLVVGHLNILTAAFGAILIGIGMDFGVHYIARYVSLRSAELRCDEALVETSRSVGPGIVTGGVTTAIAFFTVALTDFTGVVELGIIAGGGVLLCILAAMVVLPAMVHCADRRRPLTRVPQPLPIERWIGPFVRWPRAVLAGSVVATLAAALGFSMLWYDHNLLHLQPAGLESVELEQRILGQSDHSVWFAVSLADSREELLRRKSAFDRLESVQRTEEIASMLPPASDPAAPEIIQRIDDRLSAVPREAAEIPLDKPADLLARLQGMEALAASFGDEPLAHSWQRVSDAVQRLPADEFFRRTSALQRLMAEDLLGRLRQIAAAASSVPPSLSDLPPSLVQRFVGRGGKHLLRIYGRGDLWNMDALERFVTDVKSVDPLATGQPLQTFYASRQMQLSYVHAACYALVAILIAVLLDFGSIRDTLLAVVPMVAGMAMMFGLLGWFNIPLNAANLIVLPLLLGIGLDTGVHMVHDFRCQSGTYCPSPSTAVSVLITALTTIVGFGSLMIADHRGLQSLGRVMAIGAACCLFTSLVMLPAMLTWMSQRRTARGSHVSRARLSPHMFRGARATNVDSLDSQAQELSSATNTR